MNATAVATETIVEDGSWIRSTPRTTPSDLVFASIAGKLKLDKTSREIVEDNAGRFAAYRDLLRDEMTLGRMA